MSIAVKDDIEAINLAIAEMIGDDKYGVWFKNSTRLSCEGDCVKVGVPNHFIGSWIENHFIEEVNRAIVKVTGAKKQVVINIDPELSGSQKRTQLDSQAKQVQRVHNVNTRSKLRSHEVLKGGPLKYDLDTFVVGDGNQLAYNAAMTVVGEERSLYNPLFYHGGYGVGKTHLLQGICNRISRTRPSARWLYVSAEDFANQFVLALKTQKLDAFRKRFRQMDVLAIDDIHFLASKPSMQEEFLHTFNTIDLAGKQVILASDAHPKMIGQLCDSLVNRFVSGMVVKLDLPDFKTRCQICRNRAAQMGKTVPDNVVEYIAEKMRSNVRELEGALLKLVAYSAMSSSKMSLGMAQEVLADHISRTDPIVHISDIESAVSTYFGVTTADIHSSKKDRTVSLARSFSMYLARKYTKMSYPEIGRLMGGKNHATVILANRKVEEYIELNSEIKWRNLSGSRIAKARAVLNQLTESIS